MNSKAEKETEHMPKERKLDKAYFRVKRGEKWRNICWTDLTPAERDEQMEEQGRRWFLHMTEYMLDIAEQLNKVVPFAYGLQLIRPEYELCTDKYILAEGLEALTLAIRYTADLYDITWSDNEEEDA